MNNADSGQHPPTSAWIASGPVALIYSPHAGSTHGAHPQALLERAGVSVALAHPVFALDAEHVWGDRWREAGCVAAVAAGGDGTIGAVASHAAQADLPMGILPMGTANDIARALEIPLDHATAARVIAHGALQRIDAGQVIPSQTAPHWAARQPTPSETALSAALTGQRFTTGGAYFLHALTLGLNVEFARLATDVRQRQMWGRLTYLISAIESLERVRPIEVTLRFVGMAGAPDSDMFVTQSETALLAAINLPVFGGRLGLRVPGVRTDDSLLDVVVIEAPDPRGARAAIEAALGALTGAAQSLWGGRSANGAPDRPMSAPNAHPVQSPAGIALPGARWFRARAVEIETEQPVELTLDGELRGRTPAVARVAPTAVRMIVPATRKG